MSSVNKKLVGAGQAFKEGLHTPGKQRQLVTFLLVLLSWAILIIINSLIDANATGWQKNIQPFVASTQSIVQTILGALLVFWLASIFLFDTKSTELKNSIAAALHEASSRPSTLADVDWESLIQDAEEIDFVVQGWNGWMEQREINDELVRFFARGGIFNLYVYDDQHEDALHVRKLLEGRISRTPDEVKEELVGTRRGLLGAHGPTTNSNSQVNIYKLKTVNWYFAFRFKTRSDPRSGKSRDGIIFSIYSHTPTKPWKMPATLIAPAEFKELVEWFDAELAFLRKNASTEPSSQEAS